MGRARRGSKKQKVAIETFDSDDERAYSREEVPDPSSSSYYRDEVDDFHLAREKVLLDRGAEIKKRHEVSSEEEVLGFSDDDDNDEKIADYEDQIRKMRNHSVREKLASDIEDDSDAEAERKAWGKQKSKFYGADVKLDKKGRKKETKQKYDGSDSEDLDADELEEREALAIQRSQTEQLTDEDFGLNLLQTMQLPEDTKDTEQVIVKDISLLNENEKRQLLMKESPELFPIIDDYSAKLTELRDRLLPLVDCYRKGFISQNSGVAYILTKAQLYFNYCTNISFYLLLKLQRQSVQNHPVIKRIVEYRNIIKKLESIDDQLDSEIDELLASMREGTLAQVAEPDVTLSSLDIDSLLDHINIKKKKRSSLKIRDTAVDELLDDDSKEEDVNNTEELLDEDGRRAIDYEIAKNKGLKPQRKKELRNPRVKHRLKYRKALIRRRGQVREVRTEVSRYGGEASGIRAGVKKSIKLKV